MIGRRKLRKLLALGLVAGAALLTTACTSTADGAGATTSGNPAAAAAQAITHVHAIARDPATGEALLATHQGLFTRQDGAWVASGPAIDLMGFTIAADGTYLASGHPGPGIDLPQPVGLIASTDRGRTWTVQSRGGQSDFHALAAGPRGVLGFDGRLRLSPDRRDWSELEVPGSPHDLAVSPKTGVILATTEQGLLRSTDAGATWSSLPTPELVALVDFADDQTVVGASVTGRLVTSRDAGTSWSTGAAQIPDVTALSAATRADGTLETLLVSGTAVLVSTDAGQTTQPLG